MGPDLAINTLFLSCNLLYTGGGGGGGGGVAFSGRILT